MTQLTASEPHAARTQPAWAVFAVALAIVAATASVGSVARPDGWYMALAKPAWNPPNYVFAPVWTVLYVMIAIAGATAWRAGAPLTLMGLWLAQIALNGLWSVLFFAMHRPGAALIDVLAMLAAIVLFAISVRRWSGTSAALFVPYIAWVGFASVLNWAIVWLN